jgi:hypothetical protein
MGRRRTGARDYRFPNSLCTHGLRVKACRFSTRWKAFLGQCPSCPHRHGEAEVLWLAGKFRITIREERDDGQHIGRIGFRLGCAWQ